MARGSLVRRVSLATRLAIVALLVTLVSLSITAFVGLSHGSNLADEKIRNRLAAVGASRAAEVSVFIDSMGRQVTALAASPTAAESIAALGDAYRTLGSEPVPSSDTDAVSAFYRTMVAPDLEAVRGGSVGVADLIPDGAAALRLQAAYVVPGVDGDLVDDRSAIDDAGDGSAWSQVHAGVHPSYRDISARAGFADLYLIDSRGDVIVYSVGKGIDFGTSLDIGPFSGSTLAQVVDAAEADPTGRTVWTDFARYQGDGDRPMAFVARQVRSQGMVVGVVAARIDTAELNDILTGSRTWNLFGATGETYLAGMDNATMRTDARPFVEDPKAYLTAAEAAGSLPAGGRQMIEAMGTTALVQSVDRDVIEAARAGGVGLIDTTNYLGDDVVTAYRTLPLDDLDWVLFAEAGAADLDRPVEDYARNLLAAVAVVVVVSTFLAVWWSNRLVVPLRIISERLRRTRSHANTAISSPGGELPAHSAAEFRRLADDIDRMSLHLVERQAEMTERSVERVALLRQFLPAAVVKRAELGEHDVLDVVADASVVVLALRGLGELVRSGSNDQTRALLERIVDELDALAQEHGVERMKLTGGSYFAACGIARPYLDHAPRCVAFAIEASTLVDDIGRETGVALALGAGVDSGSMTVGLIGGSRLVYDVWGAKVSSSAMLARLAPPGGVLASPATGTRLAARFDTTSFGDAAFEHGPALEGVVLVSRSDDSDSTDSTGSTMGARP